MIRLSTEQVLALHRMMAEATGGDPGLRDRGLLESTLASAFQTFGGAELYPTTEEKIARTAYALISDHAFLDGNKRIGMFVLLILSELCGLCFRPAVAEVTRVGLSVAAGEMTYADLLAWMRGQNADG